MYIIMQDWVFTFIKRGITKVIGDNPFVVNSVMNGIFDLDGRCRKVERIQKMGSYILKESFRETNY